MLAAKVLARPEDFVLERTVGVDGSYGTQLYPVPCMLGRTTMLMTGRLHQPGGRGYRARVGEPRLRPGVQDCCASYPDEWHRFSLDNIMPLLATVTTFGAVIAALGSPPPT